MTTRAARRVTDALGQAGRGWLTQRERGTRLGIRLVVWIATALGRRVARQLARAIALYYVLFDPTTRRASRLWLERAHGRVARWSQVYGHVLRFTRVSIDRVFLVTGQTRYFQFERTGQHHLQELARTKRGAVLIGAHLGSFEAMRASASDEALPLNIVGHFENARMINALLAELNPGAAARVLHVGDDPVGFALQVRERLDAGELVALLADRVGLGDRRVSVPFFGQEASFPSGPFLLAALMKSPVYLVFGLYDEPDTYRLYCEPFAESLVLPRAQREAALQEIVARYAGRLEAYCRRAPDNWFNFYDFWQ